MCACATAPSGPNETEIQLVFHHISRRQHSQSTQPQIHHQMVTTGLFLAKLKEVFRYRRFSRCFVMFWNILHVVVCPYSVALAIYYHIKNRYVFIFPSLKKIILILMSKFRHFSCAAIILFQSVIMKSSSSCFSFRDIDGRMLLDIFDEKLHPLSVRPQICVMHKLQLLGLIKKTKRAIWWPANNPTGVTCVYIMVMAETLNNWWPKTF